MFAHLKVNTAPVYKTAQEFLGECVKYFQWAIETPLQEEHVFMHKGCIIRADKAKVRAFTKTGLAQFLSIPASRLQLYKDRGGDWAEAVELVEQAIFNQKFENAAAGLMNATIIARDLGLAEKTELGGIAGAPPVTFNINPIAAGTFLAADATTPQTEQP